MSDCRVCHGDGYVEVGDREIGGIVQAVAVDCPCRGGDLENLPEYLQLIWEKSCPLS